MSDEIGIPVEDGFCCPKKAGFHCHLAKPVSIESLKTALLEAGKK